MKESTAGRTEEEALRAEAEFGRAILQRAAEGLCVCHAVAEFPFVRFTVWNEAMVRLTGYTIEEINRLGWYQTLYPDPVVQARAMERMARMRVGEDMEAEEWEIQRANGVRRHVQISTSAVPHRDGATHILALIQDITERKRAEATREALLFLEQDLGSAGTPVEAARAIFGVADRLWAWDAGYLNLYSADGSTFDEVLNIDIVDGVRREVPLVGLSQGTTEHMRHIMERGGELRLRRSPDEPEGDAVPLKRFGNVARRSASMMFVPLRWRGQPVGMLSVQSYTSDAFTGEDLRTLQGLADHCGGALRRIQALESLRLSEEDLHRAQAVARTGSWYLELLENRLTWSAETCRIFGLPVDTPKSVEVFAACIHPEDSERVFAAWQSALSGAPFDVEHRIQVADEIRWVRERAELTFDSGGRAVRAVGTTQDVTDRKRAEERRDQLEEQLRQAHKMETVGHLAGGVAHDFNNILAGIVMNLGLIWEEMRTDAGVLDLVAEMEKEAHRAAGLVRQLLLFARRQVMAVRCLDLDALLDPLLQMLRRTIGADIDLARFRPAEPCWIAADSSMIDQVITNLVLNARDSMRRGGRIEVRTEAVRLDGGAAARNPEARAGKFVCLTVADTGVGMDGTMLRRIFEPFFTTKGIGEGAGLGLSTVYGIVRQHHGWIEVESEVGRGSTFRVYLPAAQVGSPAGGGPTVGASTVGAGGSETVLVVDDEPAVCRATVKVLSRQGYRVLSANDGPTALGVAGGEPGCIDVLLTDLVMPGGMDGLQLAARLRDERPGLRVVLMSGYGADSLAMEGGLPAGAVFLPKPFVPGDLLKVLAESPRSVGGS